MRLSVRLFAGLRERAGVGRLELDDVAHAAGLTDVILPERNRGDLDDVPEDVRQVMSFHPVMTIDEVLERALEPAPKLVA